MRIIASFTLFTALALFAATARAQAPDAAQGAAARALFQDGVARARRGDYPAAIEHFRRAYALRPAAPVAYNLAVALAHEGELVEASELLEGLLRDPSIAQQMRTSAERQRDQIAPRLARLTVRLEGDTSDVRLDIDAREVPAAMIGVPLPIDPGSHEVLATRDGEDVGREQVDIMEGERRELVLTIAARVEPEPQEAVAPVAAIVPVEVTVPPDSGSDDTLLVALGIAGGVVLVGAIAVTAAVLTSPQSPSPVMGNAMPGVLTW